MCLFGHTKSWFSNQISNPGPLIWEHKSLSHWSTSEIPTPVFLPAESHGQRSLVGYSPWGLKEWDTTEWTEHARAHMLSTWFMFYKEPSEEKEMGAHTSTLAWRIPCTEEPGPQRSLVHKVEKSQTQLHFHF